MTPTAVVTVDPIALHVTDLSTAPGAKLGLDLRLGVNKKGRIQITGIVDADRRSRRTCASTCARSRSFPLQPYFQDQVSLTVTRRHRHASRGRRR